MCGYEEFFFPALNGRARVLDCLAPWLCLSPPRSLGSAGPPHPALHNPAGVVAGGGGGWLTPPLRHHTNSQSGGGGTASSSSSANANNVPGASSSAHSTHTNMVKTFQAYLPSCHRTYSCIHCRAHLANHDELISKSFQGSQGRAYLFNSVVNVGCGPAEERVLLTGLHAVADIYCKCCENTLGWKYEHAFENSQKYKEGKFIIELAHMIKDNGWD
ncbi:protein yippee-like 2 [Hyalella azteca]|uniref:Protein yippee-like 2 n=1 Tax=Hyalella azteca TaxID=294128 RepID=A0A8B7NDK1_HYAAZ|nr:protein yippee-like 2 [Hyalella azteca]